MSKLEQNQTASEFFEESRFLEHLGRFLSSQKGKEMLFYTFHQEGFEIPLSNFEKFRQNAVNELRDHSEICEELGWERQKAKEKEFDMEASEE